MIGDKNFCNPFAPLFTEEAKILPKNWLLLTNKQLEQPFLLLSRNQIRDFFKSDITTINKNNSI
jgi:hypothetical protein